MKKFLSLALLTSLLLNGYFLLQRRREPPPRVFVRTQNVGPLPAPPSPVPPPIVGTPRPELGGALPVPPPTPAPPAAPVAKPVVTLLASPTYATADGEITVSLTLLSGTRSLREWIGLYAMGDGITKYVSYQMVSASPSYVFKAPQAPGEYEFRYILEDDRTPVATSNSFRVIGDGAPRLQVDLQCGVATVRCGGEIPARWLVYSGRRSPRDWIGLYAPGARNEDFLTWKYVTDADQGVVVLKAPDQPGIYEMRYLFNDGFECVALSTRIVVVQ